MSWTCNKCNTVFNSEKRYIRHLNNTVPCDYKCNYCNKTYSKASYFRHIKTCKKNTPQTINNVNTVDNSNTLNNVNNHTNMVFLAPYGLEHRMMEKEQKYREQVLGSTRDKILDVVRQQNFTLAYQMLFDHIHGNEERPEHHNIFIQDRDRDEVCMFTGKKFTYQRADEEVPGLYRFLMCELKWMVGTAKIDFKEKDQLLHDIKCHWRLVNEEKDQDIRRMLYNNKPIVEETMNNNIVKPNTDMLEDYYNFERGTLKSYNKEIKLPK